MLLVASVGGIVLGGFCVSREEGKEDQEGSCASSHIVLEELLFILRHIS